jgi:hypothetical protein
MNVVYLKKSTKDPLLVPEESRNVDVHREGSVMDIHRDISREEIVDREYSKVFRIGTKSVTQNRCKKFPQAT